MRILCENPEIVIYRQFSRVIARSMLLLAEWTVT